MAETAAEVSTIGLVDATRSPGSPKRRQWTKAFKRQIVAETLEPGASVSIVARRHDVNANQLFKWRREMAAEPSPAERWQFACVRRKRSEKDACRRSPRGAMIGHGRDSSGSVHYRLSGHYAKIQ